MKEIHAVAKEKQQKLGMSSSISEITVKKTTSKKEETESTVQGLTNLIFACMDFCAHKMVLHVLLCAQNSVCIKELLWVLIYVV